VPSGKLQIDEGSGYFFHDKMIAPVLLMGRGLLPLSGLAGNNPASCREKNTPTPEIDKGADILYEVN
jgi:hypothetical protein